MLVPPVIVSWPSPPFSVSAPAPPAIATPRPAPFTVMESARLPPLRTKATDALASIVRVLPPLDKLMVGAPTTVPVRSTAPAPEMVIAPVLIALLIPSSWAAVSVTPPVKPLSTSMPESDWLTRLCAAVIAVPSSVSEPRPPS